MHVPVDDGKKNLYSTIQIYTGSLFLIKLFPSIEIFDRNVSVRMRI
jgi:hypothetical protein